MQLIRAFDAVTDAMHTCGAHNGTFSIVIVLARARTLSPTADSGLVFWLRSFVIVTDALQLVPMTFQIS